jgi:hypothetical protein
VGCGGPRPTAHPGGRSPGPVTTPRPLSFLSATGRRPRADRSAVEPPENPMNRYVAPLGFTLAAMWVVVVFVLVSSTP